MGTFDPSQPRRIVLTMIRWTRGHGNKDWDVRMKEYTSFKVVITASFYISPLTTARQMRLMIARMCRCVLQRRGTRPGSSDSGAVDRELRPATNRDCRNIACDPDDENLYTRLKLPPSVRCLQIAGLRFDDFSVENSFRVPPRDAWTRAR